MNNSNVHQTLIKKCADTKQIIFPLLQDCPEVLLDYSINFNLGNGITLAYCHSDHIGRQLP